MTWEGHGGRHIAANGNVEATSYSADGERSSASGSADPEWQPDPKASSGDAGEAPEHAKEAVRVAGRGT